MMQLIVLVVASLASFLVCVLTVVLSEHPIESTGLTILIAWSFLLSLYLAWRAGVIVYAALVECDRLFLRDGPASRAWKWSWQMLAPAHPRGGVQESHHRLRPSRAFFARPNALFVP
jgi:hypothetical protein